VDQLSRLLFLIGTLPFIVLGLAHALLTLRDVRRPTALSPTDPALREAMAVTPLILTRATTMWRAWLGFNLSHSLGVIFFGGLLLALGLYDWPFVSETRVLIPLAVVVSGAYLLLAVKFWFQKPAWGAGLGLLCFLASWVADLALRG